MIISHKHKFIFIRPRKVAGTSVGIALGRSLGSSDVVLLAVPELQRRAGLDGDDFSTLRRQNDDTVGPLGVRDLPHVLPQRLRDVLGKDVWESYLKFTIVRNPWDWFISLHMYWLCYIWDEVKVPGLRGLLRPLSSTLYPRGRAFAQAQHLLRSGQLKESVELALRRGLYARQLAAMERFYFIDGCQYANCYLRFENLQDDFDGLCQRLGIEQSTLPRAKTELRKGRPALPTLLHDVLSTANCRPLQADAGGVWLQFRLSMELLRRARQLAE